MRHEIPRTILLAMPLPRQNLHKLDSTSFPYVYEENVTVPAKNERDFVRCNVYRPRDDKPGRYPVLVTYGPYGKDVPYSDFHPASFADLPFDHVSTHSAWETPDPGFWTRNGYVVVRADEIGTGQSPGVLDTMSPDTSLAFADLVEWAADQPWSNGKVGLLGISYYAGSQWRVAARQPKGLSCIIPWEGMSDYYRDRCRHGGILSNGFIKFWWDRQVLKNQYGRAGRAAQKWGPDTIEGGMSEEELQLNLNDQTADNEKNRFLDQDYYRRRDFNLADIQVPLLSVGNWGGILLHLRGNVEGFLEAGSNDKFLRFITGRHDLPFYQSENVAMQKSFLDACLKGDDPSGWFRGQQPRISYRLREGNVGYNDSVAENAYPIKSASSWPLPGTEYVKYYLTPDGQLGPQVLQVDGQLSYKALGDIQKPEVLTFATAAFSSRKEITGHIVAHLNVSVSAAGDTSPSDMDIFLTLRHFDTAGDEIFYTGTTGDPVPVTKGWLRCSLRAVNTSNPRHRVWRPWRDYRSVDASPLQPEKIYAVDVEVWPTNVVVLPGEKLCFEVSSGDTQGCGIFQHDSPQDRRPEVFAGENRIHFGPQLENWVSLPVIPN